MKNCIRWWGLLIWLGAETWVCAAHRAEELLEPIKEEKLGQLKEPHEYAVREVMGKILSVIKGAPYGGEYNCLERTTFDETRQHEMKEALERLMHLQYERYYDTHARTWVNDGEWILNVLARLYVHAIVRPLVKKHSFGSGEPHFWVPIDSAFDTGGVFNEEQLEDVAPLVGVNITAPTKEEFFSALGTQREVSVLLREGFCGLPEKVRLAVALEYFVAYSHPWGMASDAARNGRTFSWDRDHEFTDRHPLYSGVIFKDGRDCVPSVQHLSVHMECLKNIVGVTVAHGALRCLPKEIGMLRHLTILDVSHNQLRELPWEIGDLKELLVLNCQNNCLKRLPGSIGNLKRLQALICDHNQLEELPAELENLFEVGYEAMARIWGTTIGRRVHPTNLNHLDCSYNCITYLPPYIDWIAECRTNHNKVPKGGILAWFKNKRRSGRVPEEIKQSDEQKSLTEQDNHENA